MKDPHLRPLTLASASLALFCAMLWGANAVAVRFTQEDLPPLATAWIRFALSIPFLAAWFRFQGTSLMPKRGEWGPIGIIGFLLFAQIGLFHYGLDHTNASLASLIIGLNPVIVAFMAHFALKGERLTIRMLIGLTLAAGGLYMVFQSDKAGKDPVTLLGNGIIFASCLLLGLKIAWSKHVLRKVDLGRLLVWNHILAVALLCVASAVLEGFGSYRFSWQAAGGIAYMGIVISVFCFTAWTWLLKKHPAGQLQVFAFGQPVFGVLFGMMFRGDPLTIWVIGGTVGIGLGILLVGLGEK